MIFVEQSRNLGNILLSKGGFPIGRIIGFGDEYGQSAIVETPGLKSNVMMVPIYWVCPLCHAQKAIQGNCCRLCGAYLKPAGDI